MSSPVRTAGGLTTDEAVRLRLAILRTARAIRQRTTSPITPSQVAILGTVDRHGPLTIGEIATREQVQPPSASRVVATLEGMGMVVRTIDPADRRVNLIETSEAGAQWLADYRAEAQTWISRRTAELDPDDVERLRAALPALERLLEDPMPSTVAAP